MHTYLPAYFYPLFSRSWAACVFYHIAHQEGNFGSQTWIGRNSQLFRGRPVWQQYIMALYFSTTVFTAMGDAALFPYTITEMAVMIVYLVRACVARVACVHVAGRVHTCGPCSVCSFAYDAHSSLALPRHRAPARNPHYLPPRCSTCFWLPTSSAPSPSWCVTEWAGPWTGPGVFGDGAWGGAWLSGHAVEGHGCKLRAGSLLDGPCVEGADVRGPACLCE